MTTTPLLRWRKVPEEHLRGALQAYETGDVSEYGLTGGLVRIEYTGRGEYGGWRAMMRESPDANFADGWFWRPVMVPENAERPDGYLTDLHQPTEATVKAVVREWWHRIEPYARSLITQHAADAEPTSVPAAAEDAAEGERDALAALQADAEAAAEPAPVLAPDSAAALLSQHYTEAVADLAARLRRAADRVERWGKPSQSLRDLKPDHTASATHVIDEITGTVGNLGMSRLINAARDADRAARSDDRA